MLGAECPSFWAWSDPMGPFPDLKPKFFQKITPMLTTTFFIAKGF
jgi:hypothetical protein